MSLGAQRQDRQQMLRVSAAQPCPVCRKPDWCLVAPDGAACLCQRVTSDTKCGEGGWLHRLTDRPPGPPGARSRPARDWGAEAARLAARFTTGRKRELADRLGLPPEVLDAIPLVGADGAAVTFPECGPDGAVVGIVRRLPDGSKRAMPGSRRGLTLPAGWRDRPGPVFVVEGASDALALTAAGLAAVGRPTAAGGGDLLAALFADLPADRPVLVVGEQDAKPDGRWPGRDGAVAVATRLAAALDRPVGWALPPDGAKDVRAYLTDPGRGEGGWPDRGAGLSADLTAGATTVPPPAGGADVTDRSADVPEIVIGTDEHRVNAEAAAALAAEPDVFQRGGLLVHVLDQDRPADPAEAVRRPVGAPAVRELARPLLRERLTRCARWQRYKGEGEAAVLVPAHPPDWCVGAVHARGRWPGVRPLDAVVTYPVLMPDGSLLTADGYHPATGLLARLPPGLAVAVPDRPTRADVAAAVADLLDVVRDFPFAEPAHRAAWVAGLLTPLAWFLFDGPAPLFLIDKNVRGAGAGLLADVIALTVTGRRFACPAWDSQPIPGPGSL